MRGIIGSSLSLACNPLFKLAWPAFLRRCRRCGKFFDAPSYFAVLLPCQTVLGVTHSQGCLYDDSCIKRQRKEEFHEAARHSVACKLQLHEATIAENISMRQGQKLGTQFIAAYVARLGSTSSKPACSSMMAPARHSDFNAGANCNSSSSKKGRSRTSPSHLQLVAVKKEMQQPSGPWHRATL